MCCEAVRSAVLATAWLLVYVFVIHFLLYMNCDSKRIDDRLSDRCLSPIITPKISNYWTQNCTRGKFTTMFTGLTLKGKDYYDRLKQMNLWTVEDGGFGVRFTFRDVQRFYQDERK